MAAKPEDLNLDYNCSIKINGSEYLANTDETILDVSKRNGIEIPHLCFKEGMSCLLYTSPSPRDLARSRMPSSA